MLAREKLSRSANTEDVCHCKDSEYVKSDVDEHKSQVAPMMAEENVRIRLQEFVCGPEGAELTAARGVRIRDVATEIVNELAEVLLTCLARRRLDCYIFDRCTGNLRAPECLTNESFDDVGIGRHSIHPLPPAEVLVGLQHAIKCDDKAEEKAEQLGSNCSIRRHRSDPMRKGSVVHRICDPEHEVGEPRTT